MTRLADIAGQKFGRLTVIRKVSVTGPAKWLCQCECGNTKTVYGRCLRDGVTQSCGCLRAEGASKRGKRLAASHAGNRLIDLTGQRFGSLIVQCRAPGLGVAKWHCLCDCGGTTDVASADLRKGRSRSCGCGRYAVQHDLTGQTFGRLTALHPILSTRSPDGAPLERKEGTPWVCKCECGEKVIVYGNRLVTGNTSSCGCLKRKLLLDNRLAMTHGGYKTPEWRSWHAMIDRCCYDNSIAYHAYGGKGITVCEHWRDFANFITDMGPMPTDRGRMSVDRFPDNKGGYWCGHCPQCLANGWTLNARWATYQEQAINRTYRGRRMIEFDGETLSIADWARRIGIDQSVLSTRLRDGWTVEEALTIPTLPTEFRGPRARERYKKDA